MSEDASDDLIVTDRLLLRPIGLDDADALFELDSDPLVRRYVEDGEPVSLASARSMIEHWRLLRDRSGRWGFWAAIERDSGRFVGWFHLRPGDGHDDREPELGYRLVADVWGRGYGTEGSTALVDLAFSWPDVEQVVAETMAVNVASRRVMEKVGMRHVRSFVAEWPVRIEGDEHGDVTYAITRDEWERRRRG